jgi:hypothetical protein
MRPLLLAALLATACSDSAPATTACTGTVVDGACVLPGAHLYYLDAVGGDDDTGDGSKAAPWKTVARVLPVLVATDVVLMLDGSYDAIATGRTGEPDQPWTWRPIPVVYEDWVTFQAYPGAEAHVASVSLGTLLQADGSDLPFTTMGNSDLRLRVRGLVIDDGVEIFGSRHVEISGCTIHNAAAELRDDMQQAGVRIFNGRYVTIEDNEITHVAIGVQVMSHDVVIRGNEIHHNCHDGLSMTGGDNVLVEGNVIHDLDDGADDDDGASWNMHVDGVQFYTVGAASPKWATEHAHFTFRGNVLYHLEAMGVMIGANTAGGEYRDFVWENNVFGPVGGILFHLGADVYDGFVFRNNTVLYAPGDAWTSLYRPMNGQKVDFALWDADASFGPGYQFYNNVFVDPKLVPDSYGFVSSNRYLGDAAEILDRDEQILAALPYPEISGDLGAFIAGGGVPGLPLAGSPLIDTGSTHGPVATDIRGVARDAHPDIGAYELTADEK